MFAAESLHIGLEVVIWDTYGDRRIDTLRKAA
jgi:hypothetical protein